MCPILGHILWEFSSKSRRHVNVHSQKKIVSKENFSPKTDSLRTYTWKLNDSISKHSNIIQHCEPWASTDVEGGMKWDHDRELMGNRRNEATEPRSWASGFWLDFSLKVSNLRVFICCCDLNPIYTYMFSVTRICTATYCFNF